MTTPHQLIDGAKAILLDFDGPMAYLMPAPRNAEVAARTREAAGVPLPGHLASSSDHIAVLKYLAAHDVPAAVRAHEAASREEIECASVCEPAPWFLDLADHLRHTGTPVAVATNNSPECVRKFLERWKLWELIPIVGRSADTLGDMKPAPTYLAKSLEHLHTSSADAIFIGDSVSDVISGNQAGIKTFGFAKSKVRAQSLLQAGALGIVSASSPLIL